MIDYAERIAELSDFIESEFGVKDLQLIGVLLAARVEADVKYPWFILETDYFSLDTTGAWFNFGKAPALLLSEFRLHRPYKSNERLDELLHDKGPRLLIESQYQSPVNADYRLRLWPFLLQECLRARVKYPRRKLVSRAALQKLAFLADAVLDNRWRTEVCRYPTALPASLLYYAELLQRLNGKLYDWIALLSNLCVLAGRHAYLFNKDTPDEADWDAVTRVIKDTVPPWTARIIEDIETQGKWTHLKEVYPKNILEKEIKRLSNEGLIKVWHNRWNLVDTDGQGHDIVALLNAEMVLR
jgi:hypothetical protein